MAAVADVNSILQQVYPANARGLASGTRQEFLDSLNSRQIVMYDGARRAGDCANAGPPGRTNLQLASQVTGKAAGVWASLAPAVAALRVVPIVGAIIGGAITAFTAIANIFSHHSQAVAREQGTLCSVVPQVNQTLLQIDADFAAGNLSMPEATAELDQVKANYLQATAPIYQSSGSKCNAACVVGDMLDGEILIRKQSYQGSLPAAYYLKHYWWVGVLAFVAWLFIGHRVSVRGN